MILFLCYLLLFNYITAKKSAAKKPAVEKTAAAKKTGTEKSTAAKKTSMGKSAAEKKTAAEKSSAKGGVRYRTPGNTPFCPGVPADTRRKEPQNPVQSEDRRW